MGLQETQGRDWQGPWGRSSASSWRQVGGGEWDRPREARPSWVLKLKVKDEGLAGAVRERSSILGGPTRAVVGTFHSQPRS